MCIKMHFASSETILNDAVIPQIYCLLNSLCHEFEIKMISHIHHQVGEIGGHTLIYLSMMKTFGTREECGNSNNANDTKGDKKRPESS